MDLQSTSYLALFLIVSLGLILGRLEIRGIRLDISAIVFVALVFGHYGILIPAEFQKVGLLLFIFTIGIQAGPGFFQSFKRNGWQLVSVVFVLMSSAVLLSLLFGRLFQVDRSICTGLLTGALTSTPGLAAAIDASGSPLASIGYGIAYPFGVIGVILFVTLFPRLLRKNVGEAEAEYHQSMLSDYPEILNRNYEVSNPSIVGKTLGEVDLRKMTAASISRVMKGEQASTPLSSTVLEKGDLIKAVGSEEALRQLEVVLGKVTDKHIPLNRNYEIQSILVSNRKIVGKNLGQLNLMSNYNATVTRIRRSGIDITPTSGTSIRMGDKLMVASDKDHMKEVIKLLGNKRLSNTNFLPIALGIVIGILVGKIEIRFTDSLTFSPGLTGGVLATALLLSYIGKTGPIIWSMSGNANQLLRQLGLLFFLASVGTHAGADIVQTFEQYGWSLFLIGVAITLIPMIIAGLYGLLFLRMNILSLMGVLTGGMTSTPGLAATGSLTNSNAPSEAYAAVYPIAMVLIILGVQLIS